MGGRALLAEGPALGSQWDRCPGSSEQEPVWPSRGQAGEHVACASCLRAPPLHSSRHSLWACPDSRPGWRRLASSGAALGPGIPHGAELRARKEQEPVGEFLVLSCACSALCMWGGGGHREVARWPGTQGSALPWHPLGLEEAERQQRTQIARARGPRGLGGGAVTQMGKLRPATSTEQAP